MSPARSTGCILLALLGLAGCATPTGSSLTTSPRPGGAAAHEHLARDLSSLNDEELFAEGSAALAANELEAAARAFGRLVEAFPNSAHRPEAILKAGTALENLGRWDEAAVRFSALADPRGAGPALEASFKLAEALYHLQEHDEAAQTLSAIAARTDLPLSRTLPARVQEGICELEAGRSDQAEQTLRRAEQDYEALSDRSEVDLYFPAQAAFFLGEIYRQRSEAVPFSSDEPAQVLHEALEHKAQLLLSAEGHYLHAIRLGHPRWATAAGTQIGALYENLYQQMVSAPAPKELKPSEAAAYQQEVHRKIRTLLTKAINIYEETLDAAQRIGESNPFVDNTRERLKRMKDLLVADVDQEAGDGGTQEQ